MSQSYADSLDPPSPPPGWHTDPDDATHWRYWSGTAWTEHRTPRNPQASDSPPLKLPSLSKDQNHSPMVSVPPPPSPAYTTTSPDAPAPNPPGWHPDPAHTGQQTYQNSGDWSEHHKSSDTPPQTSPPGTSTDSQVPPTPISTPPAITSTVSAGWYRDPDDSKQWRYWDGSAWTERRSPLESSTKMNKAERKAKKASNSSTGSSWIEQGLRWWERQGRNTQIAIAAGGFVFIFLPNILKIMGMLGALIVISVVLALRL